MMKDFYCTRKTTIIERSELPAMVSAQVLDEIEDIKYSNNESYVTSECALTTWFNTDNEPVENEWRIRLVFRKNEDDTVHFADLFFGDNCQLDATRTQHMVFSKKTLENIVERVQKTGEPAYMLDEMDLFKGVA